MKLLVCAYICNNVVPRPDIALSILEIFVGFAANSKGQRALYENNTFAHQLEHDSNAFAISK